MITKQIFSSLLCIVITILPAFSQCVEDSHSPFRDQGWLSCEKSKSANSDRAKAHWIQYDLGKEYSLRDVRLWNHNVWGETDKGVKSIIIDYSLDGSNWSSVGILDIPQAPGSWKYVAPEPIELNNIIARHVLITVSETWEGNADCAGIAELRFGVEATTSTRDELASVNQFSIFPNPASDLIQVDFADQVKKEIWIVNSVGQTVRKINLNNKSSIEISISDLESGMYYINILSQELFETNSFVKL